MKWLLFVVIVLECSGYDEIEFSANVGDVSVDVSAEKEEKEEPRKR